MMNYNEIIDVKSKCYLPFDFMTIAINGIFYACCYISVGDVYKYKSIVEAWNCEKMEKIRSTVNSKNYNEWPEQCKKCPLRFNGKSQIWIKK